MPTVLLVEDDADDVFLARQALARVDNRVELINAVDGVDALGYLRKAGAGDDADRPDLVVVDLSTPRMSGLELLQEIKQDESLRRIPVVVLTTSSAVEDIEKSYELGAAGYLVKPSTFSALVETFESLNTYWFVTVRRPPD